jgi:hypothetical protein
MAGIETAIGQVNARVLGLVPRVRRSALLREIIIDIDATDVKVYGPGKGGVAYNYQGQRCGRADIAYWMPPWQRLGEPTCSPRTAGPPTTTCGKTTLVESMRRQRLTLFPR